MYTEIIEMVKGMEQPVYFDSAIQIKKSPHDFRSFYAWGVRVSPKNELYIMDADQQWWNVEEKDEFITASLYQRLKYLKTA